MDMARELKCRGFVSDGNGGYRSGENDLTPEERKDLGARIVSRMGRALNDHYSAHPEEYRTLIEMKEETA